MSLSGCCAVSVVRLLEKLFEATALPGLRLRRDL